PEQAGGTAVDHRTDIYAFGVILYELVTGRRPFNGQSFGEYVIAHLSVPPTPPIQLSTTTEPIPEALEALIMQCLAKPPPARPQTMRMVGERLAAIEASFETIRLPSLPRPKKRQRSARFWVLAATMVFLAGVLVQQASARRSREPAAAITAEAMPKVRVTFDSTPQGAQVFREGSDAPLGVTPLEWSTESSSHPE